VIVVLVVVVGGAVHAPTRQVTDVVIATAAAMVLVWVVVASAAAWTTAAVSVPTTSVAPHAQAQIFTRHERHDRNTPHHPERGPRLTSAWPRSNRRGVQGISGVE
jgi:hypothetical protein